MNDKGLRIVSDLPSREGEVGFLGRPEWDVRPAKPVKEVRHPLSTMKDRFWFNLGPIYVCAGLRLSLTEQFFRQLDDDQTEFGWIQLPAPVLPNLGDWGSRLECMPVGLLERFKTFVVSQVLTRKEQGRYWALRLDRVTVLDPLDPVRFLPIWVGMPAGTTGTLKVTQPAQQQLMAGLTPQFRVEEPLPHILEQAWAAFGHVE